MQQFTDEELMQIIAYGESDRVEFKQSLSGDASEKIREAICAFANDLPNYEKPGFVFIGVKDDKTIVGLSNAAQVIEQLSHMKSDGHILPLPSMTVEKHTLEDQEVVVVRVEPADSPPVRCKGVFVLELDLAEILRRHKPENFGQPDLADYRNPNLAEAMRILGYVQRFGVGISIARRLLQESGHPELEFEVVDNHVLTTIMGLQQPERT